ncbi:MAG TPA: aspartyl protease family protein, partial [Microlunatus sp.]
TKPAEDTGTGAFGHVYRDQLWRASISIQDVEIGNLDIADAGKDGKPNVGQDLLSQYRCHYKLADHQLIFDATGQLEDGETIYLDPGKHVYLQPHWPSGIQANAVFDSGASITVIDTSFANRHPELMATSHLESGVDAGGHTEDTPVVELDGPTILGHTFTKSTAAIVDLTAANATIPRPMDMILGWPLISQVDWIIDHPAQRACVIRP